MPAEPFSLATPYRTHTSGDLRADDAGTNAKLAGWVHRRRDYGKLIFIDLRDRHGITQVVVDAADAPEAHEQANRVRPEYVIVVEGEVALREPGQENPKLATGADRAPGAHGHDPQRGEDAAVLRQRPGRDHRREPAPQVPLPRHPPGADAAPPAPAQPPRPGHPRGPPRRGVRRGRDAQPDQEHPGGRARLHRPSRGSSRARSTRFRRAPSSSSSCSWSRASTATSRSRAASATRTCAATASRSSPSSTSR